MAWFRVPARDEAMMGIEDQGEVLAVVKRFDAMPRPAAAPAFGMGHLDDPASRVVGKGAEILAAVMLPADAEAKVAGIGRLGDAIGERRHQLGIAITGNADEDGHAGPYGACGGGSANGRHPKATPPTGASPVRARPARASARGP